MCSPTWAKLNTYQQPQQTLTTVIAVYFYCTAVRGTTLSSNPPPPPDPYEHLMRHGILRLPPCRGRVA